MKPLLKPLLGKQEYDYEVSRCSTVYNGYKHGLKVRKFQKEIFVSSVESIGQSKIKLLKTKAKLQQVGIFFSHSISFPGIFY